MFCFSGIRCCSNSISFSVPYAASSDPDLSVPFHHHISRRVNDSALFQYTVPFLVFSILVQQGLSLMLQLLHSLGIVEMLYGEIADKDFLLIP